MSPLWRRIAMFLKSEYRIMELIYENPGIRLSELIKRARVSVATANKRLDSLLSSNIVTEKKTMGGKKVLLKNFYPNLFSEEGRNVFSLIESKKKQEFFERNKDLAGPFDQLLKNIDKKIKIILIFGSFTTYSQDKDSDLDILFLIDEKINQGILKKEIERSFVTFKHEISPRIDILSNFKNEGVYQTIIKNHIIVKGALYYFDIVKNF